ncbi:hypothetical protein [Streptomyces sp. NPDC007369]|uniref:hypothetical protein n=1 Tax=Streptomyces sp. NPDC007369 TaxID=3154589 RepID=UPI0033D054E8
MFSSLPTGRALAVGALLLTAAATPALAESPKTVVDPPPCKTTGQPMAVTNGTVTWCEISIGGKPGARLTYENTARAHGHLSLVIYDCDGGQAPSTDRDKCASSLAGTYQVIWRDVKSQQSVTADFRLKNKNAQVWWTDAKPNQATDLKLLGTPWNA